MGIFLIALAGMRKKLYPQTYYSKKFHKRRYGCFKMEKYFDIETSGTADEPRQ